MPRWSMSNEDRFRSKVYLDDLGCHLWSAGLNAGGYGKFSVRGKYMPAHRWAYESVHGPVPPGMVLDHLCRVRHCVNPAHLEAVTQRENLLRGTTFTADNAAKSHCTNGHGLIGDNLYVCPNGWRQCRVCRAQKMREHYARTRGV